MLTEPMLTPAITFDRPWPYKPVPRASGSTVWARLMAGMGHLVVLIRRWRRRR